MSDFVPGLVLGGFIGLLGACAACGVTTDTIRANAVQAGVGEYYVPRGEKKAEFRWLPSAPPHAETQETHSASDAPTR
jgi:hypothetical protein